MQFILMSIEMMGNNFLYNGLFNYGKRKNLLKYMILVMVLSSIFIQVREKNSMLIYLFLNMVQAFFIAVIDKKDKSIAIVEYFFSMILSFVIQNIYFTILYLFTAKLNEWRITTFILYIITIILINIILKFYRKKRSLNFEKYIEENLVISNIVINTFIFFAIFKYIYDSNRFSNIIVIEVNVLILISIFLNISFYKSIYKKVLKNKNMEVKNTYNPLLDSIIQNIKANEHEYKNHINMIYSTIQVSKSIPEIRERTSKYIKLIQDKNSLANMLDIDSIITKAVLYSKIVECENLGVKLNYQIKSNIEESKLEDTEITILLSNLLNNAIEATKNAENKEINIAITKMERYRIEIKNNILGLNINNEDLEKFFKKGFSSKGANRGYGLYNVKKIVNKYNGSIYSRVIDDFFVIEIYV